MRAALTVRQREVLEFIRRFLAQAGYPPTVREIGAHFGFVPRSVFDHLKALERKGYLRRTASKSRSLQILDWPPAFQPASPARVPTAFRELPILGRVAAGEPLLAEQNVEGTFAISRDWVNGDEAFLLKVQGESMIGVHILPGDYALVRRQATAENGEIIVALVNDEATVKRVFFKKDVVVLQPENPAMPPIQLRRGEKTFQIIGKVIGILRKLCCRGADLRMRPPEEQGRIRNQIRTVDRERLVGRLGRLSPATVQSALLALQEMFSP